MTLLQHLARMCSRVVFLVVPGMAVHAQTIIEIGSGTLLNNPNQQPSAYANLQPGSRSQYLFRASELQAAGMTPGTITALAFHVEQPSGSTLQGFTVSIGTTPANVLTQAWETGLATAAGPANFTDQAGWNTHPFSTPFVWDGTSNMVVETCFHNGTSGLNARVYQSTTGYTSWMTRNSPSPIICTDPGGTHVAWQRRPNVRFTWMPIESPPVAAFQPSSTFTCTGTVSFTDQSLNMPGAWSWDFGDGTVSDQQNPTHTYTASGNYIVTLTVTNAYGSDSQSMEVTVDLSAVQPLAACPAPSSGTVVGFGILNVTLQGTPFPSNDAVSEGYLDNTCQAVTVAQGAALALTVATGTIAPHAVRAWLDLNNSGTFGGDELILSGTGPLVSGGIVVPSSAPLQTPLRLRVVAAYDLVTPNPAACGTVQYGQAEDYAVIVLENTLPPEAAFALGPAYTCDGTVQFTDASLNAPTSWLWDFGDGNTSTQQHPQHTYATSGSYTVTLTVTNANGQDQTTTTNAVTVDLGGQPIAVQCTPNTQAYCCGFGILGFQFAGIASSSTDASEGYQDRSCGNTAQVQEGLSYPWSVLHDEGVAHDTRIWIDLNNDGAFGANELMATALDQVSPAGTIAIPAGAVFGTPLRLRVQSDVVGQSTAPCAAPLYGQVEDFGVVVAQNTAPPTADFSATPQVTCDGAVQFTDLSTNLPTGWLWDFGDGNTSTAQNPLHTYSTEGSFDVTLTATNAFGSDTEVRTNYVSRIPEWQCDTLRIQQPNITNTACQGILSDNGGPNGNYLAGTSGAFTISPVGAATVALQFSVFQWGNNPNRRLAIYDGPNVNSPLIGSYTGNGLQQLPNGGSIVSTGPSITLRQESTGGPGGPPPNTAGFLLTWSCSLSSIDDQAAALASVHPVPASDLLFVDLRTGHAVQRLVVHDAVGRTVLDRGVAPGTARVAIEVEGWAAGVYVLSAITGHGREALPVIIR